MKIFIHRSGKTYGAYSLETIQGFVKNQLVHSQDFAWTPGFQGWTVLDNILGSHNAKPSWLEEVLGKDDPDNSLHIINWICDQCGLKPLEVDAKRMYVTDSFGGRHLCLHPLEYSMVEKYLGENASDQLLQERTGHCEDYFCTTCFKISLMDEHRDKMICPKCKRGEMNRGIGFANQKCPKCMLGFIKPVQKGIKFIDDIAK